MARTTKFREQHVEILRLASALRETLKEEQLAVDAAPARRLVSQLLGKLTLHLAGEDNYLYPELQNSPDAEVAAMARRFAKEMGGIAGQISDWGKRWPIPDTIKADPRRFISESSSILDTLKKRMHRENLELYATADAVLAA